MKIEKDIYTVKIYDDYKSDEVWMECSGTRAQVINEIQHEFCELSDEDIGRMLDDTLPGHRTDMTDFGDVGDDFWVEVWK